MQTLWLRIKRDRNSPKYYLMGLVLTAILMRCFYRAWLFPVLPIGGIVGMIYGVGTGEKAAEKRLKREFRLFLQSLEQSLGAGYSLENAIPSVREELSQQLMKHAEDSIMYREVCVLEAAVRARKPILAEFTAFAQEIGDDEICLFAELLSMQMRSGGNLIGLVRDTALRIEGRVELEEEIRSVIASQILEFQIMCAVPCLILLYMQMFAESFVRTLYEGLFGRVFMTCYLAAYLAAAVWGLKLCRMEDKT